MKTGRDLIDDVNACRPEPGTAALWWLGQMSFILKLGPTVLYLDPYLTDKAKRNVRPLLAPSDLANADAILGTHDHTDHIDRPVWPAIAAAAPKAVFIVPDLLREALARDLGLPLDRFIGLDYLRTTGVGEVRITGIPSAHEFLNQDRATGLFPYLGYIIEGHGVTLYHSGDCCKWEGLQTALSRWRFDVMILPINGRDAVRLRRNCIGNMTYQEAADLAGPLGAGLTIPGHFDMFSDNAENPALFTDYMSVKYPSLRTWIPQYGERFLVHHS